MSRTPRSPPPLPPRTAENDARVSGSVYRNKNILWTTVLVLVLLLYLGFSLLMRRCFSVTEGVLQELSNYNTQRTWMDAYRGVEPISAEALLLELVENGSRARRQYEGEPVVVRGAISEIRRNPDAPVVVVLGAPNGEIRCSLSLRSDDGLEALGVGEVVVLGGVVDWMNKGTVRLRHCRRQEEWQTPPR